MIEVNAKLIKGATFLSGDTVDCLITFTNPAPRPNARSQCNSDVLEVLAWASAQIHCHCTVNEAKVKYPKDESVAPEEAAITNTETSFAPCHGERGHVVLSTKPKILFCDLRLLPGESKSFPYCQVLPSEGPPTYKGQGVKYSYKITIGTQRVNSHIKLLRVPLRVLVLQGIADISQYADSEDLTPSNPFLDTEPKESPLDIAMQILQNITAKRSPNVYNITNNRGKVVRFSLFKLSYKLGEDIIGTFDFRECSVPCVQYSVTLQSEENVSETCQQRSNQGATVVSYSKVHEMCLGLQHANIVLPIPLHITPGFQTNIVNLSWHLHFEFVTTTHQQPQTTTVPGDMWQGPTALEIETMVWNLPVKIYPTSPLHLAQGLPTQSEFQVNI